MTTPTVDDILTWLLRLEDRELAGKIVDEGDGVGLTRFGLNQKWDSHLVPADFFSTEMPSTLAVVYAKQFYRDKFWYVLKLDSVPMPLAASVLSCAVNCGITFAHNTLDESKDWPENEWLDEFIAYWKGHYTVLAQSHPSLRKFLNGWIKRAEAIYPNLP